MLINDGCHGLGAEINGKISYAIKYADFVTYSFHPVKPFTTAEGGAITTNNKRMYGTAVYFFFELYENM